MPSKSKNNNANLVSVAYHNTYLIVLIVNS